MDDDLHSRIEQLAHEEHRLLQAHSDGRGLSATQHARLADLERSLDRAWDLLRQREARRRAGLDPSDAQERPADVIEHYQQ